MPLTATVQETLEYQREQLWQRAGVPAANIEAARLSGIDARDIGVFKAYSLRSWLFVLRCPKAAARAHHGTFPPKIMAVKDKTGPSGLVVAPNGAIMVSDYDMMSVWQQSGAGWRKLFISAAHGAARGKWSAEAQQLVVSLNQRLQSKLQHGCQDDYHSPKNPGVKGGDHFAAFMHGRFEHLAAPDACAGFYSRHRLAWP